MIIYKRKVSIFSYLFKRLKGFLIFVITGLLLCLFMDISIKIVIGISLITLVLCIRNFMGFMKNEVSELSLTENALEICFYNIRGRNSKTVQLNALRAKKGKSRLSQTVFHDILIRFKRPEVFS